MRKVVALILLALLLTGCQPVAKNFGGTIEEHLPKGKKLVTVTWKNNSLWTQMRDMRSDEKPEIHEFREASVFGLFEGKVIIFESR